MSKPPPRGDLARKLAERTLGGRARLYHWLRLRYHELAKAKAELNFTWKDLAETVADAGALNAFGQRPDAEAVRKAWLKLEADMRKKEADSSRPAPASVAKAPAPYRPSDPDHPAPKSKRTFGPISLYTDADNPAPKPKRSFAPSGPKTYPPSKDD